MSVISQVKDRWSDKVEAQVIEELFLELDRAIRASYEKRLRELQDESTKATEADHKMLIAVKIDELGSWKNELIK